MKRRDLLLGAAGLGGALAGFGARAATPTAGWTVGFRGATGDFAPQAASVRGRFPAAVHGALFRNGPAVHELGGQRYHHWFDGDGMVQRFAIGAGGVEHRGRIVRTPKYVAEAAAGKRLIGAFGSHWPGMEPVSSADSLNVANTSLLPLGDELLALWEGGSAYRLDPGTLNTLGAKVWRDDLAGLPFSAHPRVDVDGTIWNFGLAVQQDMLLLYEIAPDGRLRRAEALKLPATPMLHDFAVTSRHLVFLMPPLLFEMPRFMQGESFLDSHAWRPNEALRVLVVDKADWRKRQWLELPAGFLFHIGNAWEDAQGVIRLDYIHADGPSVVTEVERAVMDGRIVPRPAYSIAQVRIDTAAGKVSQQLLRIDAEFPRIDARLGTRRHTQLFHATQTSRAHPGFSAIAATNVDSGRSEHYSYGEDYMAEEHVFVPEPGTAPGSAGWLLGTALDFKRGRTLLSCLRSDRLADGPVAQATLPYALPLGIHGVFVPA